MTKNEASYQTLSAELDKVLDALQQPDVPVDEAMMLYEQGLKLVERLQKRLKQAENTLIILKEGSAEDVEEG